MSDRTRKLHSEIIYKDWVDRTPGREAESPMPEWNLFRREMGICFERAHLMTQSYKETEGESEVIRRAKALAKILERMTIYIMDGEVLVGNYASDPASVSIPIECSVEWVNRYMYDGYSHLVDEKGKEGWKDIYEYWKDRSIEARMLKVLPEELKGYVGFTGCGDTAWIRLGPLVAPPNFDKLFKVGINGIIKEAEERFERIEVDVASGVLPAGEYINQRDFLEAAIISLKAAVAWAHRYGDRAKELAKDEKNPERKEELKTIAEICDWVPGNPPRTLHEAMQCFMFVYQIWHNIENHYGNGIGVRVDQIFYPFYTRDRDEGRITREQAQELVEFLMIKIDECGHLLSPGAHIGGSGGSVVQNLVVGGVRPDGRDGTNEFSFIVLDAAIEIKPSRQDVVVRYHPAIDQDLILRAIDVVRLVQAGYPSFFNDSAIIPMFMRRGASLEVARDYGISACVLLTVPGKNTQSCTNNIGDISALKALELALFQGYDHIKGRQLGPQTADPRTFTSFEELKEAYLTQLRFALEKIARIANIGSAINAQYGQKPFISALTDGCIEKGKDRAQWAEQYGWQAIRSAGNINCADSLAAIKRFIFDEKIIAWDELLEALKTDFEGKEDIRQRLINEAPKFGNDDDYVDEIVVWVQQTLQDEFSKFTDYYGNGYQIEGSIGAGHFPFGRAALASADGRRARQPLADGNHSPMQGRDKKGPTAVLKSMGKDSPTWSHLSNQKFLPTFLEGENKDIFAAYLKTWCDLGCSHIQFNVVDKATLEDAQARPENHADLMVRVAGYSAYFVHLHKAVQDDIIYRTEQSF